MSSLHEDNHISNLEAQKFVAKTLCVTTDLFLIAFAWLQYNSHAYSEMFGNGTSAGAVSLFVTLPVSTIAAGLIFPLLLFLQFRIINHVLKTPEQNDEKAKRKNSL